MIEDAQTRDNKNSLLTEQKAVGDEAASIRALEDSHVPLVNVDLGKQLA